MKIVICSMGYSGYSTACWRALAGIPGIDLVVYTPETDYPYQGDVLAGLDVKVLNPATFSRLLLRILILLRLAVGLRLRSRHWYMMYGFRGPVSYLLWIQCGQDRYARLGRDGPYVVL